MNWATLGIDLGIIVLLVGGFAQFRAPRRARLGNAVAAGALALAAAVVLLRSEIHHGGIVTGAVLVGTLAGLALATRVTMIQIPAMVAFQHGAGGLAALLVSLAELTRLGEGAPVVAQVSGLLGLVLGAATFSGSMLASGKLAGLLSGRPTVLPRHGWLTGFVALLILAAGVYVGLTGPRELLLGALALIALSVALGWLVATRIGGADMPVLISFLNATAGVAAAFCGVIIGSRLLVACGATVAASGTILTLVMCKAMNRSLFRVFTGLHSGDAATWLPVAPAPDAGAPTAAPALRPADPFAAAVEAARGAARIVVVPGYGMAQAQAQFEVVALAKKLAEAGKDVKYAIHPVAGRMPGHMNVLLAEADVSYDDLLEMDDANPRFRETDLVLVVGACDVVNPAAVETTDTPISGMPILNVLEARAVVVCNLDEHPGYSGVPNRLYDIPSTILLLGDAKDTVSRLAAAL